METVVVAALAGLLGIVPGRVWDFRLEAVRWRRDQRVRVYEALAATADRDVTLQLGASDQWSDIVAGID